MGIVSRWSHRRPWLALGEPCVLDPSTADAGAGSSCEYYAYCDETTRRCLVRKGIGDACDDDHQCFDSLVCGAGKCQVAAEATCP
jgi:hypothetical protein